MLQDPRAVSTNEREALFEEYNNVYQWALGILSQRTLTSEIAHEFVRDETATGVNHVLRRLADTKVALSGFAEAYAQNDPTLRARSEQLLTNIKDIEQKAEKIKDYFLNVRS